MTVDVRNENIRNTTKQKATNINQLTHIYIQISINQYIYQIKMFSCTRSLRH